MDYIDVEEAIAKSGLRLVLTEKVPGPWGEASKGILSVRKIPYTPVRQRAGQVDEALRAWTGQISAPVAMYEDERPRSGWAEILLLAERLEPSPRLIPEDPRERAIMLGLCFFFNQMTEGPYWASSIAIGGRHAGAAGGLMNTNSAAPQGQQWGGANDPRQSRGAPPPQMGAGFPGGPPIGGRPPPQTGRPLNQQQQQMRMMPAAMRQAYNKQPVTPQTQTMRPQGMPTMRGQPAGSRVNLQRNQMVGAPAGARSSRMGPRPPMSDLTRRHREVGDPSGIGGGSWGTGVPNYGARDLGRIGGGYGGGGRNVGGNGWGMMPGSRGGNSFDLGNTRGTSGGYGGIGFGRSGGGYYDDPRFTMPGRTSKVGG